MRGRKPEPAAIKEAKGNPGRRPIGADPSGLAASAPRPPAFVEGNALEIWRRYAELLASARLLTEADANAFGRYCRNLARWVDLQDELDAGLTYAIETASGTVMRPKPQFLIADRLERMLLAIEDRFGLSPSERQRIMAARSQTGVSGDLFGPRSDDDPAARPTEPAAPIEGPLGLLN